MPCRYCGSCRSPLHADDGHSECVSCLGKSHADAALTGADCSHCETISLASLCSRIAFFSESDSAPCALPFSSSQRPVRKKQRGRGSQCLAESELRPAQTPRASLTPQRVVSPVLFSWPDQCPSASANDLVSFGRSDEELADNSIASDPRRSSLKFTTSSQDLGAPPTRLASVLKLHPTCPSHAGPLQCSLDAPMLQLDRWLRRSTAGDREVHGQPGGVWAPPVAHADGDQGCKQGLIPWCPDFSQRPLWTCGGRIRGAFYRGTEGVAGHATLPAQALQLHGCFESPQACANSAARETCTCRSYLSACQGSADARAFTLC